MLFVIECFRIIRKNMDKHKIPHDTLRKTLERIQIMRKNIRGILVTATVAVTFGAVCITGSMLPIRVRAFGDREVAGTEQTNGSATPRDIAIDLSDFFGNAEEIMILLIRSVPRTPIKRMVTGSNPRTAMKSPTMTVRHIAEVQAAT